MPGPRLPLVLYWLLLGGSDSVTPEWAWRQLMERPENYVLVDVREGESFAAKHLAAAINWPLAELVKSQNSPAEVRDKTPLFICDVGQDSRRAARYSKRSAAKPSLSAAEIKNGSTGAARAAWVPG